MTPDKMLEVALQYAGRGWPVFPLSRSKVPFKGSHGHLDATTDRAVLEAAWQAHPGANIGLATGDLVVLDCDGEEGLKAFLALGKGPRTLVARTPRGGLHFYYRAEGVQLRCHNAPRSVKGGPGLDIKGHGGFVLLPPSRNRDGSEYQWLNDAPPAPLPQHIIGYAQSLGIRRAVPRLEVPTHLAGRAVQDLAGAALAGLGAEWTAHEEARIAGALKAIGNKVGYDQFLRLGFALHGLGWERSDGTNAGFDLWNQWAERFPETYNLAGLEKKWESFGKSGYTGARVTIGTVFALAQEKGWTGEIESGGAGGDSIPVMRCHKCGLQDYDGRPGMCQCRNHAVVIEHEGNNSGDVVKETNGVHYALPAELTATPIIFPDVDKAGRPKATCTNARVAIESLGIECRKDAFHERSLVAGHVIGQWAGDLSDDAVLMIRKVVHAEYGFDAGERNTRDAAVQLCLTHQFNPVTDYLAGLRWDGRERIGTWACRYLGAAETALHRAFGRLMLIGAVRRARAPGSKFDQIVVLEGPQGVGKSTALRILAGDDNFSDQHILGASDKEQQEAFCGVWIHEIAELAGMRRTDVERIKQFARRTEDRARPAYGRIRVDMKRRGIFVATTNETIYLKEWDRAFWPIACGAIDLAQLRIDRDQLWAEAACCEARGESAELSVELRALAAEHQAERQEHDAWEDMVLESLLSQSDASDTSVYDILRGGTFQLKANEVNQTQQNRISRILKKLGYERYRVSKGDRRPWRYKKSGTLGQSGT